LHLALELGQQAFQRFQVVALDDAVVRAVTWCAGRCLVVVVVEHYPVGHVTVMVFDLVLSDPMQRWHAFRLVLKPLDAMNGRAICFKGKIIK